jgi:hypothetical protein
MNKKIHQEDARMVKVLPCVGRNVGKVVGGYLVDMG